MIDISRYFNCKFLITSDVSIHLTSLKSVSHVTSEILTPLINSVIYDETLSIGVHFLIFYYLERKEEYQKYVFSIFFFVLHFHRLPLQWENVQNQHTRLNIFGIQLKK